MIPQRRLSSFRSSRFAARRTLALAVAALPCIVIAAAPSGNTADPAAAIVRECKAVAALLPKARVLATALTEDGLASTIEGSYDGTGRLLRLVENIAGEKFTTFREFTPGKDGALIFLTDYTETNPDTAVPDQWAREVRAYFADGKLVRFTKKELRMGATFERTGPPQDLSKIKAVEQPPDGALAMFGGQEKLAARFAGHVEKLASISKPAFTRTIEGSTSPDGKFAVGWCPDFATEKDAATDYVERLSGPNAHNFLVQLNPRKVVHRLDGEHGADIPDGPNRIGVGAEWSKNSAWLLETSHNKFGTDRASLWHIEKDGTVSGPLNILTALDQTVLAAMKKAKHPAARRLAVGRMFVPEFSKLTIGNDGTISASVSAMMPHFNNDHADEGSYEASFSLKPATDGKGAVTFQNGSATLGKSPQ
jgi:hypothetical protein